MTQISERDRVQYCTTREGSNNTLLHNRSNITIGISLARWEGSNDLWLGCQKSQNWQMLQFCQSCQNTILNAQEPWLCVLFIRVHFNNPLSSEVGNCLALLHVPPQSSSVPSPLWPIMSPPNTITLITTMRWAPEAECKESSHAILRNLCHISITKSTTISTTTPHNWQHHHLHHLHHHHHLPRDIAQSLSHLYHQVHHHHHWHNNTITSTIITISKPSITELRNPSHLSPSSSSDEQKIFLLTLPVLIVSWRYCHRSMLAALLLQKMRTRNYPSTSCLSAGHLRYAQLIILFTIVNTS